MHSTLGVGFLIGKQISNSQLKFIVVSGQYLGAVSLVIHINDQNLMPRRSQLYPKIDAGRGFATTSFLIGDGDHFGRHG